MRFCHSLACGGHFGPRRTARYILDSGLYWPTLFRDSYDYCKICPRCQNTGNISRRNEMPRQPLIFSEVFDVWGINFKDPFPNSFDFIYILFAYFIIIIFCFHFFYFFSWYLFFIFLFFKKLFILFDFIRVNYLRCTS